jgi:hypothetical protein
MAHDDREVQQWLARDPACPRWRSPAAWARFGVIRRRLLRHLLRDPWMWGWQGWNVLVGLARYALFLGVFLVLAPPILAFWGSVLWPAAAPLPRLPLPAPESGPPVGGVPVLGSLGVLGLLWLVMLDILCGYRLSRWSNVFMARATRIAWVIVDAEPPAALGTAQRCRGATEQDTPSEQGA